LAVFDLNKKNNLKSFDDWKLTVEQLDKIKNNFPIVDLVSHYTELKPRGKSLTGICPICKSKKAFTVSPQKNICKCFSCGKGGNPINFIKNFENLDFRTAVDFIITKFSKTLGSSYISNDLNRGTVYVLKLQDNCFYIGFTNYMTLRMEQHFSGNGAVWTKKHKPISIECEFADKTLNYENYLTEEAIKKYGYDYVRGGDHMYFAKKYGKT
jgi:predicted GIY-YIG superfamily endonuclease